MKRRDQDLVSTTPRFRTWLAAAAASLGLTLVGAYFALLGLAFGSVTNEERLATLEPYILLSGAVLSAVVIGLAIRRCMPWLLLLMVVVPVFVGSGLNIAGTWGPTVPRSPPMVSISGGSPHIEIRSMAADDEALIAIAWDPAAGGGVAVTEDLAAWRFANFSPRDEESSYLEWLVSVNSVASWSQGLVAAGVDSHDYRPTVWHYRVDHFERGEVEPGMGPSYLGDIAQFRNGLVAVGADSEYGSEQMLVWISPDGTSWRRFEIPIENIGDALSLVTAGPDGIVALGNFLDQESDDHYLHPFVMSSSGGEDWTRLELPVQTAYLRDLATTPFGYIAVGHNGLAAVIFVSRDGKSWSQVPEGALGNSQELRSVTSYGDWTYAVGDGVFVSSDGMTWTQLDSPRTFDSVTYFAGKVIAANDDQVIELPYPPLSED